MSETPSASSETDAGLLDLWPAIEEDVTSRFGEDVEVTVTEYDDHLDVLAKPAGDVLFDRRPEIVQSGVRLGGV